MLPIWSFAQTPIEASAARHFEVTIYQSTEKGSLANGNRWDWEPGDQIQPGNQTRNGMEIPFANTRMSPCGLIFIRGLSEIVDNADWAGMLEPDGIFRYTTITGATRTVPAFKLSAARDPVVAYWEATRKMPPVKQPWTPKGTALDQRSGNSRNPFCR